MTAEEIDTAASRAMVKFATAKQIRQTLDAARDQYGPDDWDSEDLETEVLDLVTGEAD